METFVGIAVILSCPLYWGTKYFSNYIDAWKKWGAFSKLSAVLFTLYIIFIFVLDSEELHALAFAGSRKSIPFLDFFLIPSVGFGLAMFPRAAAEQFSEEVEKRIDWLNVPALIGWFIQLYLLVVLFTKQI